jgi:hypothetical protein
VCFLLIFLHHFAEHINSSLPPPAIAPAFIPETLVSLPYPMRGQRNAPHRARTKTPIL